MHAVRGLRTGRGRLGVDALRAVQGPRRSRRGQRRQRRVGDPRGHRGHPRPVVAVGPPPSARGPRRQRALDQTRRRQRQGPGPARARRHRRVRRRGIRGRPDRRGIARGRGCGRTRRAWQLVAHQLAQPCSAVRRAGGKRRGAHDRARAAYRGRRRSRGAAERRKVDPAVEADRREAEDRRLPLHDADAEPRGRGHGRGPVRRRRRARSDRGCRRGQRAGASVPAARRALSSAGLGGRPLRARSGRRPRGAAGGARRLRRDAGGASGGHRRDQGGPGRGRTRRGCRARR